MVEHIKSAFPKLADGNFQITSERDDAYNCIAWAAGDLQRRWWPSENPNDAYWPADISTERDVSAFEAAFATLGYVVCDHEGPELGFEKIALFVDENQTPTHAARQLTNGRWTSKLGKAEDIEHDLYDLEGECYGAVSVVMKRRIAD